MSANSRVSVDVPSSRLDEPRQIGSMIRIGIAVVMVIGIDVAVITFRQFNIARLTLLIGLLLFAVLVWWCRRPALRLPARLVMIISALTQLPGLFSAPVLSDDAYRYVWDGRVQLAGIDPYRYTPLDLALAGLRDPLLFPPGAELPLINRSWVHTIYPPVAELWFAVVAVVTPWGWGTLGIQIGSAALVVVTSGLLASLLREQGCSGAALIYGACPATTIEAANGGHVDVLAALFLVLMGWAVLSRRFAIGGVFLGLAAGVKLVPLLLLPVFLLRRRLPAVGTAIGTFVAGYLPHLLAVGSLVIGFLPGYLAEEGFDGRRRFALLIFLPEQARLPVALLLAVALAGWAVLRSRHEEALVTCCWLYGAAFLVATPAYPWYLLPLMVIVIMARRWEWLALWPAAYVGFLHDHQPIWQTAGYGLALLVIVLVGCTRAGWLRTGD